MVTERRIVAQTWIELTTEDRMKMDEDKEKLMVGLKEKGTTKARTEIIKGQTETIKGMVEIK